MEIEEVDSDDQYMVLNVTLSAGEAMPLHYTTSEAMLIGRKGKSKITFADRQLILSQGDTMIIKANEPHKMETQEDFSSYVILDIQAGINFSKPAPGQLLR